MNRDPIDYELIICYLDDSAPEEDRHRARELLLRSPEARAYLIEVAGQMVHLYDHHSAFLESHDEISGDNSCRMDFQTTTPDATPPQSVRGHWSLVLKFPRWLSRHAGSLLVIAGLLFSTFAVFRSSNPVVSPEPSLQISDFLGHLTVNHHHQNFKSPFRELPRITAGDTVETHNWLSWAEFKLDSGAILTVPVNSKIHIRSFTKDRMEIDVISGAVRVKSARNDPFQFVIHSERLHVIASGSEILVWDFSFGRALAASFSGTAKVASVDETQNVQVEPGWMASTDYNDTELRLIPHPKIVHSWSSQDMKPNELGTGIWRNPDQPGMVKLLAAPKMYVDPDGTARQIQEVLLAAWRKSGMVRLKGGSRLIVSGRCTKQGPVSFGLRTHSDYGKLLDVFVKTEAPEKLAAPGEIWTVEIPVEAMKSTFRSDQNPLGSLLFSISVFSNEEIGLEVNSVELKSLD